MPLFRSYSKKLLRARAINTSQADAFSINAHLYVPAEERSVAATEDPSDPAAAYIMRLKLVRKPSRFVP